MIQRKVGHYFKDISLVQQILDVFLYPNHGIDGLRKDMLRRFN